jgi:beta-lactam-binding protein with PASTA domain
MNDAFKMFLIALVTALACQLLLGPYILELQGFTRASRQPAATQDRAAKLEQGSGSAEPASSGSTQPEAKLNAPNLEGMTVEAARERWRDKGLVVIEQDERIGSGAAPGTIIDQRPTPGSPLASLEIRVTVAKAAADATVPNVVGKPLEDARKALVEAGFEVAGATTEASREPKGTVIRQNPAADQPAKQNSIVRLVIAESPGIAVPKVTGIYLAKAKKTLQEAGLVVGSVRRVEHEELGQDYVLRQDPQPGAEVPPGTAVELTVVAPD